jgi:hypothetical protein
MIQIPDTAPEATLLVFVRAWFKRIAAGRMQEACAILDEPNACGIRWTPERIHQAVEDAFGITSAFRSRHPMGFRWTDPDELGDGGNPQYCKVEGELDYSFEHDVPLNGEWSELTAKFRFVRHSHGYAVALHDLSTS